MLSNLSVMRTNAAPFHRSSRVQFVTLSCLLLALAACSQTGATSTAPTPTATTAATVTTAMTATLTPAQCGARYGSAYATTLPDATYQETAVYAQVTLPPETRSYDDDASGLRVRFMCSAGTTDSVSSYMTQHLTQLGWQVATTTMDCGRAVIPNYGQPQCWKDGKYQVYVGINSNADWVIAFIDPAFL